jgi:hypothetical protein
MSKLLLPYITLPLVVGVLFVHCKKNSNQQVLLNKNVRNEIAISIKHVHSDKVLVELSNTTGKLFYVIPIFSFKLGENSTGVISYLHSNPQGSGIYYVLGPWLSKEFELNLKQGKGSFFSEETGQEVILGINDKLLLDADCKIASFDSGQALETITTIPVNYVMLEEYLDKSLLDKLKRESELPDNLDKLPPIDQIPR